MDESLLLRFLGDTPIIRVVDFLIENSIFDYTKTDIAENSGISRASLYNVWPVIEEFGIVSESRKIGNTTLYKLNKANPLVQKLIGLDLELSEQFADIAAGKKAVPSPSSA